MYCRLLEAYFDLTPEETYYLGILAHVFQLDWKQLQTYQVHVEGIAHKMQATTIWPQIVDDKFCSFQQ